jgi:hypothetical protein
MRSRAIARTAAILILLAGCAGKDKVSSGIIPINKMKTIVWDMIQADTYSDLYLAKDTAPRAKLETLQLYAQVLQLHQVSREDFQKSFQFYIARPDLSRELFDSVQSLGARDRAAHPPILPPKTGARGAAPPQATPSHPGLPYNRPGGPQTPFSFHGRAPRGIPGRQLPDAVLPNPSLHPTPGTHTANPGLHPTPGTHGPVPHPSADSASRHPHLPPSRHPSDSSTDQHRVPDSTIHRSRVPRVSHLS